MPPWLAPWATHASVPRHLARRRFTCGEVMASLTAMVRVPRNTASTGIGARPRGSLQAPLSHAQASASGVRMPPPTLSTTLGSSRTWW
jgi:hypothetical protein